MKPFTDNTMMASVKYIYKSQYLFLKIAYIEMTSSTST